MGHKALLEYSPDWCFNSYIAGTLAENNRLCLANNVVSAFGKLMSAARGDVLCSVTTAKVCSYSLAPNMCKTSMQRKSCPVARA